MTSYLLQPFLDCTIETPRERTSDVASREPCLPFFRYLFFVIDTKICLKIFEKTDKGNRRLTSFQKDDEEFPRFFLDIHISNLSAFFSFSYNYRKSLS